MTVEILVTPDCPWEDAALDMVSAAARELGLTPRVTLIEITNLAMAESCRFGTSPTIRVNGTDIGAAPGEATALACRYDPRGGPGVPTLEHIRSALAAAASRP